MILTPRLIIRHPSQNPFRAAASHVYSRFRSEHFRGSGPMNKQSRFLAAGVALCGVVGYLMVTGMKDSMTYFLTPVELAQRVSANAAFAEEAGVRVGGRVVPGSVRFDQKTLDLR